MTLKLLTEQHLEFLNLKEAAQAHLSRQNATLLEITCRSSILNLINHWLSVEKDPNYQYLVNIFWSPDENVSMNFYYISTCIKCN